MKIEDLYLVDIAGKYLVINLDSLNMIELNKNELIIEGKLNDKLTSMLEEPSFTETLTPIANKDAISPLIITSFKCNYSCSYCYQRDLKCNDNILSVEKIAKIKEFYHCYCRDMHIEEKYKSISIMGGEPLLPENKNLIKAISHTWKGIPLTFTTNGTYLNDYIDFIINQKVNIRVSIDGTKDMHYLFRKTKDISAYDKTIEAIKQLLDMEIPVQILTVFHPEIREEYTKYLDFLESLGWLKKKLYVAFIPQFGHGCDDINNAEENIIAYLDLCSLDTRAKFIDARKLFPGSINLKDALTMAKNSHCYECYRCSCLYQPDYKFLPDGTIHFCLMSSHEATKIGRYYPYIEYDIDKINSLSKRRYDKNEKCKNCKYKVLCMGGCAITGLIKTNSVEGIDCSLWKNPNFLKYYDKIIDFRRLK